MPGAGKSTVGAALAKLSGRVFIDTDALLEASEKKSLQHIVDSSGYLALRAIEEKILLGIHCENSVIATGGSAIYSAAAMAHLKLLGTMVYLKTDLATIKSRINNLATRGIVRRPEQSFADLFQERTALYANYADVVIEGAGLSAAQIAQKIVDTSTA